MGSTNYFGFEKFGPEGSISQNGYKFSSRDRESFDALLYSIFNHDHRATQSVQMAGPSTRPTVTQGSGGTFKAGTVLYYRVSYRDSLGNETEASQEQAIQFDAALSPPEAPQLSAATTGGSLAAGTYRYALTYYQTGGKETTAPHYSAVTLTGSTSVVTITFPTPVDTDADGWNIYRKGPTDTKYYYLASVTMTATPPTDTTDDGSTSVDCTTYLPTQNTTNGTNSATIAIAATDLPLDSSVASWRVYRTVTSGSYPANSLLATITETTTEGGTDLVTSYLDAGGATSTGVPLLQSVTPPPVPQLDASDVFSDSSSALPAALKPTGVHALNYFFTNHGSELAAQAYLKTYLPMNVGLERIEVQYGQYPSGLGVSDFVTWRFSNDAATPTIQDLVVDSELATPDGYYYWQSSLTDGDSAEAEDHTDGTETSDLLATNDVAMAFVTQNTINSWDAGTLEAGDYTGKFYVRDVGQTDGTMQIRVVADTATPTVLAYMDITSPGPIFYDPPQELSFTLTEDTPILFEAEKTDANSNELRVDKYAYVLNPPTFAAGTYMTVEMLIDGTPTDMGDDVNVTIYY